MVPAGEGCTLGSIPACKSTFRFHNHFFTPFAVEEAITRRTADEEILRSLHALCFGGVGVNASRKKNLRLFSGFSADANKMDIESKVIDNKKKWTISTLKEACEILSLEKSGTREDLCKRVVDYLAVPTARSGGRSTPKKSKVMHIKWPSFGVRRHDPRRELSERNLRRADKRKKPRELPQHTSCSHKVFYCFLICVSVLICCIS